MEKLPRLPDEHLDKAREIVSRHRRRTTCKACLDRGYQGVNEINMLVTCHKCVDVEAVMAEWRAYVRDTPALAAAYGDYFEEDVADDNGAARRPTVTPGPGSSSGRRPPRAGPRPHHPQGR